MIPKQEMNYEYDTFCKKTTLIDFITNKNSST